MPTINDIAKACGFSTATVSLVINGSDRKISAKTRQRVLDTVKHMDYEPSAMARALSNRRSGAIGISTPLTAHILGLQYYASIITGIVDEAADNGITVTLYSNLVWKRDEPGRLMFTDGRCDGIIFIGELHKSIIDAVAKASLPCVSLNSGLGAFELPSIDIDNFKAGYQATAYLLEKGHRNIGYLNAGGYPIFANDRCDGYCQALRDAGVMVDSRWILTGSTSSEDAYKQAQALEAQGLLGLTALFCATDRVALGAIQGFRDAGVRVPKDISVIGIDGLQDGERSFPTLTTLNQSLEKLGKEAVRKLLGYVNSPKESPRHTDWPVLISERGSVASIERQVPAGES